ncbi:MAG: polymer-forming cytoskeletal protein [Bacteroidetes bacterium]|nr:MAG: polymer-forming cytoskeletal protein [Bacteroidota bacterium]
MAAFGKKQKDLMDSHIATIISEGCVIDGNVSSKSSIRVDGVVQGDVRVEQGVVIGDNGRIEGNVVAAESIVFGEVRGNLQVQKLEIKSSGKISGDITTNSMEVEFGAVYNGKVNMSQGTSESSKPKIQTTTQRATNTYTSKEAAEA